MKSDFSGYASKAGLKCSDGRIINPDAFKGQHKTRVPLVWQHSHRDPENVLGHAILENRSDGTYAYGFFNDSKKAAHTKELLEHGDIDMMSIWANELIERSGRVMHGVIREVSLVLSGANPGAVIENVTISHSYGEDETLEDEAIITTGIPFELGSLVHEDSEKEDDDGDEDGEEDEDGLTLEGVINTMSEEQLAVLHFLVGAAHQEATDSSGEDSVQQDSLNQEGEKNMSGKKHRNVFEKDGDREINYLSHEDVKGIVADAMKGGSMADAVENYALEHGIENIGTLFPEPKELNTPPEFIKRDTGWVGVLMGGATSSPFSRVKTSTADLTYDDARAKGYIKGNMKKDEFFKTAYRTTGPTTIYKKQSLDRDDVLDITDFDVVAWLKMEMRFMLEEEVARAWLLGDGRDIADEDKIDESCIRPIVSDDFFYVTPVVANVTGSGGKVEQVLDQIQRSRKHYKGTGNPVMFTTEDWISEFLLIRDTTGRKIYRSLEEIANELRVSSIVAVEVMEGFKNDNNDELICILVNPVDYRHGADKGGEVNLFDDFDIDYNKMKYLMETRMSGALTKPKSAITVWKGASNLIKVDVPVDWDATTYTLFLPNVKGITYTDGAAGDELRPGNHVIGEDETIDLKIVTATGYSVADDGDGEDTYAGPTS